MEEEWSKYRAPDRTSGILDVIFAEKNVAAAESLEKAMPTIRSINHKFMLLAAPKFAELVKKLWE